MDDVFGYSDVKEALHNVKERFKYYEVIIYARENEMKPNNTAGNSHKTVSIRGDKVLIDPDESWLNHVEKQGAKDAGVFSRTTEEIERERKATTRWLMSRGNNHDRKAGGRK